MVADSVTSAAKLIVAAVLVLVLVGGCGVGRITRFDMRYVTIRLLTGDGMIKPQCKVMSRCETQQTIVYSPRRSIHVYTSQSQQASRLDETNKPSYSYPLPFLIARVD